ETIGNVAMRKGRGSQNRCVLDTNAVVHLIALFQTAQNRNRICNGRFSDEHWLEAAFGCSVFFNVVLVFVERGSPNSAQLTVVERRLEHIGSVHRAFGGAGSNERVQFVDKQY